MFIIPIICATCHAHLKLLHFITLTISAEEYKFHTAFNSEDFSTITHWSVQLQEVMWLSKPPASLTLTMATAMYAYLCPIHYSSFLTQMPNMFIHTLLNVSPKNINKRGSEVIFLIKLIKKWGKESCPKVRQCLINVEVKPSR